jgi:Uma2 family endonuclease
MSASLKPLTLEEFLAWDAAQEERYEFDGTQPVAMTGASLRHALLVKRTVRALDARLPSGCQAFGGDLRVRSPNRARYPDVVVLCDLSESADGSVEPSVVVEVLSPSTMLTDRRVKPREYATVPSVKVYVMLEQDRPCAYIMRRLRGWLEEVVEGPDGVLTLPEVGVELSLGAIYG